MIRCNIYASVQSQARHLQMRQQATGSMRVYKACHAENGGHSALGLVQCCEEAPLVVQ